MNIPVENGFINIANGNLHLEFSLAAHKQRGALKLNERLVYDSRIWTTAGYPTTWSPTNVANAAYSQAGWRFIDGADTGSVAYYNPTYTDEPCPPQDNSTYQLISSQYFWTDTSGTNHPFDVMWQYDTSQDICSFPLDPQPETVSGYATDGSGYYIVLSGWTNSSIPTSILVTDLNGNEVYPQAIDRYGNYWSSDSNGNLIDDLGRTPVIVTTSGNATYYDVLAPNGTINNNGMRVRYTVTTAPIQVSTQFNQSGVAEWSGTLNPVQSIQLPDGSSYSFSYDSYGELSSVKLPTGGSIQYGWSNYVDSYQNMNRWLTSRTVGGSPPMTFTPSVLTSCPSGGTGCQQQVLLHKPSGDEIVYQFTLNNGAWNTNIMTYNGPASSGTPLVNEVKTYDFEESCPYSDCIPVTYIYNITSTTTLKDTGLTKQTKYVYNSPWLGKLSFLQQWDYYTGTPSTTPTRETDYAYSSSGYDLTQTTVFDSNHNQVAQTTYGYTTSAVATSGLPQHGTANAGGPYLQTVSQWLNTGSPPVTTYAMDDSGMTTSITDPNGNKSTIAYQCSNALPYQTTNALSQTTTYGYDCNSGAITSVKDPNDSAAGRAGTVYQYEAVAGRLQSVTYPDGGQTSYSYNSPTQTVASSKINVSQNSDQETFYDSFGRAIRSAVFNGSAWYLTDSCYDANGRLQSQSVPYSSATDTGAEVCSGSVTSYTYDGLDRPINIANADGNTQYQYSGRAVKVTGVNGVQKITQVDAFGQTTAVCEISSTVMQGDAAQNCGLDIAGTGFLTSYAYDLFNHKTTITQGVQTRVFQADSVGRPTLMQEPEAGQTTYGYLYNGTGLQVTRTRPRANQANPGTTTTSTTQYDALGRPLSIVYNDGTPTKGYSYDTSANWTNFAQQNLIGHLSMAWLNTTPTTWAGTAFSYDSMGRVATIDQCLPSGCGNPAYDKQLPYTYDLAGDPISAGDGAGITTAYTYSDAAEVTSISSSMSGPTYPSVLVSDLNEGPYGPVSYQLGNGLDVNYRYDTLGRVTGGFLCINTFQPNCTGGNGAVYGFATAYRGPRMTATDDTAINQHRDYSYDDFNRLSYTNIWNGQQTFSYVYDRYGNRWQQNAPQGGPAPSYTFNKVNNQIVGFAYDAAGNMTNDGFHSYSYDAEGNITQVDGGSTAIYAYDAFNQRVRVDEGSTATEYVFNLAGQRVSTWDGNSHAQLQGQYYWGSQPIAFYQGGALHFQHQDWQGTERMITSYNGGVEGSYSSLPWGDGYAASGADADAYHFAQLDHDTESDTEHAQFRQLSATQGRWMSPDPYNGSYDLTNPQSFNRYTYVLNSPLSLIDPSGLDCTLVDGGVVFDYELGDNPKATCEQESGTYTAPATYEVDSDLPGVLLIVESSSDGSIYTQPDGTGSGLQSPSAGNSAPNTATISVYHPSVTQCLGEAAIDAGLDLTSLSVLPSANQDSWQWQSAGWNSGFVYKGAAADSALGPSTGVDTLEKGADWVANSPWAQGEIRQFLRSQGVNWSVKHVSKDAAWLGKWAGRVGGALAAYSAYQRYQKCRGY